jgi:hypothetical protein
MIYHRFQSHRSQPQPRPMVLAKMLLESPSHHSRTIVLRRNSSQRPRLSGPWATRGCPHRGVTMLIKLTKAIETTTNAPLHTGLMTVLLTAVFLTLQHSYRPGIENPPDQHRNCMTLVQQHPRNKIGTAVKCLQIHNLLLIPRCLLD